jgi:spore maturation protein CgeB
VRVVIFCHSIASDWNHGNAHFLRGVASDLVARGIDVAVFEPANAWSLENLVAEYGGDAVDAWLTAYPALAGVRHVYRLETLDLDQVLDHADVVLVHEWSDHALVARVGAHRARVGSAANGGYALLFHDTHHRAATDPDAMAAYDLRHYDGVLAFGEAVRSLYAQRDWAEHVWTWHEAADVRRFRPLAGASREGDLVWIGNWGDDERTAELHEFLIDPVRDLHLQARVYGVRYPVSAHVELAAASIEHGGWLPNYRAPEIFARFGVTVHVPRRPYVRALPGVPTIRVFEALACGIPLVSAPWYDVEHLFTPGADFLIARDGTEMRKRLRELLDDPDYAAAVAARGRTTILTRHTCTHRVDELLDIARELGVGREHSVGARA